MYVMTRLPKPNQLLLLPKPDQTATVITLNITAPDLLFTKVNGKDWHITCTQKTGVRCIFCMQFDESKCC